MTLSLDHFDLLAAPEELSGGLPLQVSVDLIDEDPEQPRAEFDAERLAELAQTIRERGVRSPISVRPHPEQPNRWLLNFGARRLRAAKLAGKQKIPAFVDATVDSYDQVIENEQREPLTPMELALFVKRRLAVGETQAVIAKRLGKSQPYIAYVCALIDAPDWLVEVYREGRCRGVTELYQLKRLHAEFGECVETWAAARPAISRADLQQLKEQLLMSPVTPETALRAAPVVPERAQPAGATAAAKFATEPAAAAAAVSRSPALIGIKKAPVLFARTAAGAIVEVLVGEVPEVAAAIYVRSLKPRERLQVPAESLKLLGFLSEEAVLAGL